LSRIYPGTAQAVVNAKNVKEAAARLRRLADLLEGSTAIAVHIPLFDKKGGVSLGSVTYLAPARGFETDPPPTAA